MNGNNEKIRSEILRLLKKHPEGLPILEISLRLKIHRHTVAKYVSYLEGARKVVVRKIGVVSLVYTKEAFPK